jgi:hypothetical protein
MKTVDQSILKQLSGQAFSVKAPVTLTFDPDDFKINRGHLVVMINIYAKYEDCGSKVS